MSDYRIEFTKSSKKDIEKLSSQVSKRIEKKIMFFVESGKPLTFAEPLTKQSDAEYRWRIGDYRVLFDEKKHLITILKIQHRREVYRN